MEVIARADGLPGAIASDGTDDRTFPRLATLVARRCRPEPLGPARRAVDRAQRHPRRSAPFHHAVRDERCARTLARVVRGRTAGALRPVDATHRLCRIAAGPAE